MRRMAFIISLTIIMFVGAGIGVAQEQDLENLQVGITTATQLLVDVPVTHFEDADSWVVDMPIDQGVVIAMRREGRPLEVPEVDPNDGTTNKYVLGVKVMFNQRGYAAFSIRPPKPIKIPGITKALSVWVVGRSFRHRLYAHVLDYKGREMVLDMGLLDFAGWKKINIAIPTSIEQENYHNMEWRGISFAGFTIVCNPEDTYGDYYVYFDELRAVTDIYIEEHRDEDDMQDGW
ncbi:MAG: flagellar filament protein FlaA [Spirochaetes bacterium]|nr:MAG: flagellar filament protein FlaA [Spirochaetota bacterium]